MTKPQSIRIRDYVESDAAALARLFYETVHSVNRRDYSEQQLDVWAPAIPSAEAWNFRMSRRITLVAEEKGEQLAFAELESDGYLDMFYCRKDVIGQGVGGLLYETVESRARALGAGCIFTDASITAWAFFQRRGFSTCYKRRVIRRGVALINARMEKLLPQQVR